METFGPYFFDENVNGNYLHFLQQRLPALLEDIDLDTNNVCSFNKMVRLRTGIEELDII